MRRKRVETYTFQHRTFKAYRVRSAKDISDYAPLRDDGGRSLPCDPSELGKSHFDFFRSSLAPGIDSAGSR